MSLCECASVTYYPNDFAKEHINIGFLVHDIEKGMLYRAFIKRKARIKEFDDRLTDESVDMILNMVNSVLNRVFPSNGRLSLFDSEESSEFVFKAGYFESINRHFLNSVRIVDGFRAEPNDVEAFFKDNADLALYFDKPKSERPNAEKVSTILRNRVRDSVKAAGIENITFFDCKDDFTNGETVRFDFHCGNTFIKIIDPLSGTEESKIATAKIWAYNIQNYFKNGNHKVIIVVPDNFDSEKSRATIKRILESSSASIVPIARFTPELVSSLL